ncbi:class I SAM-dependent methyltransferase [Mycobacterium sp. 852002-51613_SCH5001154]|uniref:class I SAM-dependent methyltransferase n=1 Tax=Mycobacterium sp. 852002-51613_SCH5001154 TaxID=1834104 RepID=UPI001E323638|nr:class I SAM-dependent methyltransferase [Mycobacterium sp. 852002-51613_SCH5001154]
MNRFPMLRSRIWTQHPSLLWHYPATYLRHLRTYRRTADVRADYEKYAAEGQFKEHWFDVNIVPWCAALGRVFDRSDDISILEIGSWEGRSALFLLTYFRNATLTAVDTWAASEEYAYTATANLSDLEARFDHNLSACTGRLTKRKGMSLDVLPRLVEEGQLYDLIYVDGSHLADDVLVDAVLTWRLLKPGGVVIFDDFLWEAYPRARANPRHAIVSFLHYHSREYRILGAYYQIILQKTAGFDDHVAPVVS